MSQVVFGFAGGWETLTATMMTCENSLARYQGRGPIAHSSTSGPRVRRITQPVVNKNIQLSSFALAARDTVSVGPNFLEANYGSDVVRNISKQQCLYEAHHITLTIFPLTLDQCHQLVHFIPKGPHVPMMIEGRHGF